MLYPWLNENVVGGGVELGAVLAFLVFCLVVGFQVWAMWTPIKNFFGLGQPEPARPNVILNQPVQGGSDQPQGLSALVGPSEELLDETEATATPTATITTQILEATATAALTQTQVVEQVDITATPNVSEITGDLSGRLALARFSNYWPPNGGLNCDGDCSRLASGEAWRPLVRSGVNVVACPQEVYFGTRFEWPVGTGIVWTCLDRGGAITFSEDGDWFWLDFLMEYASVDYGAFIWVKVLEPQD